MLWMLYDDKRLPASARRLINGELPVYYSTVSFWEIALKRGGKGFDFAIEDDWDILLPRALKQSDVLRLDLEAFDCRRMERLPLYHRDPFDRMLVAQAVQRRFGIISRDTVLDRYDILRGW
jgi:PIN domain nuclease of toxin-antitoxin system